MTRILIIAVLLYIAWRVLRASPTRKTAPRRDPSAALETVKCSLCGMYLPAGGETACDRADCPYPGAKHD